MVKAATKPATAINDKDPKTPKNNLVFKDHDRGRPVSSPLFAFEVTLLGLPIVLVDLVGKVLAFPVLTGTGGGAALSGLGGTRGASSGKATMASGGVTLPASDSDRDSDCVGAVHNSWTASSSGCTTSPWSGSIELGDKSSSFVIVLVSYFPCFFGTSMEYDCVRWFRFDGARCLPSHKRRKKQCVFLPAGRFLPVLGIDSISNVLNYLPTTENYKNCR